nr:MAG TPA: hypothetical protein [Caudoviricetes sp.]
MADYGLSTIVSQGLTAERGTSFVCTKTKRSAPAHATRQASSARC